MNESTFLKKLKIALQRSDYVYQTYMNNKCFLYAKLLKENNDYIRSLLLTNSHLLPEFQQKNALKLLHHLDIWCCLWEHHQEKLNPNADTTFVFDNTVNFPKTEVNDLLIYSQSLET